MFASKLLMLLYPMVKGELIKTIWIRGQSYPILKIKVPGLVIRTYTHTHHILVYR